MTLTTDSEVRTFSSGDDTIFGSSAAGASAATDSISAADVLDGGAGNDTLNITNTATATSALAGATISNIETVNIRQTAAGGTSTYAIDAGVTSVNNNLSAGTVTVTGLTSGSSIGVIGNGSATLLATNASYGSTATAAIINIKNIGEDGNGGNISILNGAAINNVTINSSGKDNIVGTIAFGAGDATADAVTDVTINAATSLEIVGITGITNDGSSGNVVTVSGAGSNVTLGTLDADIDTVNASGLTAGGVSLTLGAAAQAITGGAGNDSINVADFAVSKALAGGNGTDTIEATSSTNFATVAGNATGFEVLRASGDGSFNTGLISSLTTYEVDGDDTDVTFSGIGANKTFTVLHATAGDLTVSMTDSSGTSDVVNVVLNNDATAATVASIDALSLAGVETLNITSGDALTAGTANEIAALTGSTSLERINVTGTSDFTITSAAAATALTLIDASAFTKALTVTGAAAGSTIKGGSGADSFSVAFGSLGTTTSYQGGTGDDTLTVSGNGSDIVDGDFAAITGIDNLVVTSATTTSVTLGGFAQGAIATVDANSDGRLDLTAALLTTGGTIDASALTARGVDIVATLTIAADTAGALALTGGAVNDTINVTLAMGADDGDDDAVTAAVNGGNGIDVITISNADADADAGDVVTVTSSATRLANADIITGFATVGGAYAYTGATTNAVTDSNSQATLTAALVAAGVDGVYIQTNAIANTGSNVQGDAFQALLGSTASTLATNYAALEAALLATGGALNGTITGLDADIANTESALIVLDNGVGSIVLRIVNSTTTANTITAAEIDLVGLFTNTAQLAAADFV